MKYQLDPDLRKKLKKLGKSNPKLHNTFWEKLELFKKNPNDSTLDNHLLEKVGRRYTGFWSIDISMNDKYAAIYEKIEEGNETIAYFVAFGHKKKELYNEKKQDEEG